MKRWKVLLSAAVLAFAVHLPGLGTFMTVDEELWMLRSGEFMHKLLAGDPKGTFVTTHPGATVNWLSGLGILLKESMIGTGVDTSNIAEFRMYALVPIVVAVSLLMGWIVLMAYRLGGGMAAIVVGTLLFFDPYLLGMTQIVHADALLGVSMVAAIMTFLVGLQEQSGRPRQQLFVWTGVFTGLALATKTLPALWIFLCIGVVLGWEVLRRRIVWQNLIRYVGTIVGVSMLVFVLLWPALWAKTDNLDQYIERDTTTVVTDDHISLDEGEDAIEPATFYARTVLGRVTPVVQLGVLIVILAALYTRSTSSNSFRLVLFSIGFLVLITFVAKKSDRYALPALIGLLIATGLFVSVFLQNRTKRMTWVAGVGLVVLMIAQHAMWTPYAIAYSNPLFPNIRSFTQQGWGEGLDEAAQYINNLPFDENLYIASWYPSVTSQYFKGKTLSLSSRDDHRVGYVVTYRNMMGRPGDTIASDVLDEFAQQVPEYIVNIGGIPYAWVYNVIGPYYFRQNVGEILPTSEVGQVIPIEQNNWNGIKLGFATFGRENTGSVKVHVRERGGAEDVRTITISVQDIPDQAWQDVSFDPISDSAGKEYVVAVSSESSQSGNAVTLRYSSVDIKPGKAIISGRERDGDIAYTLLR